MRHIIPRSMVYLAAILILGACRSVAPDPSPAPPPPSIQTETPVLAASSTPVPTPTWTPQPPPLVLLLAPPEADQALVENLSSVGATLARDSGMDWQPRAQLDPESLPETGRVVIALAPNPDLESLVGASPQVQFVAVAIPGLSPGANLSLIGPQGARPDQLGFLAGYLAAILTDNWRVGVISASGTPAEVAAREGFLNGVRYFCGLCRPGRPPFQPYPLFAEAPTGDDPAASQAAADLLIASGVRTIYLSLGVDTPPLRAYLASAGVQWIGNSPAADDQQSHWVASMSSNPAQALSELWPELLAGQGGASLSLPLEIQPGNPALLSPGRLRMAEELIPDLLSGLVDSGIDPGTGLPR